MMSPSFLAVSAATEAVAVANIDSPTELNAQAGTTVGERKVAYQVIANDNVYTVYYFDSADGAGATSPYVMAASGSGYWIAAGGKYTNSATVLRSTLDVGGAITGSSTVQGTRLISTIATGTAPLTVTSTTVVGNLNVSQLLGSTWASPAAIGSGTPAAGTFSSLVSNADVAASGKFLPNNSVSAYLNGSQGAVYGSTTGGGAFPFLSAGNLVLEARGGANARSVVLASAGGAFTAYLDTAGAWNIPVATGTAPLVIASTTVVGNLNVSQLLGGTWAVPGTIGSTTANTGAFTTLSASTSLSVTGGFATMDTAGGTSRGLKWGATAAQMVLYDDGAGTAYIDYQGSATNIPLNIRTKGTGVIRLLPGSGAIIGGTAGGGLVGSELLRVVGAGYFDGGLTVVGAMSVGSFAATSFALTGAETQAQTLTDVYTSAISQTLIYRTTTSATSNANGIATSMRLTVANGQTLSGTPYGLNLDVRRNTDGGAASDGGTAGSFGGLFMFFGHGSTLGSSPVTTTVYGLNLLPAISSGTIGTLYGLRIQSATGGGTITTRHGIYQEDSLADNSFSGATAFGSTIAVTGTASTADLTINATASPGLTLNSSNAQAYLKFNSTRAYSSSNQVGLDCYMLNASSVVKEVGYLVWNLTTGTAGSETTTVQLGSLNAGTLSSVLSFVGRDATFIRRVMVNNATDDGTTALQVSGAGTFTTSITAGANSTITGSTNALTSTVSDSGTTNAPNALTLDHTSSGTPAAGYGLTLQLSSKSSTTASRSLGFIDASWIVATDASRTARVRICASDFNGSTREGIRVDATGTAASIGFLGATAVTQRGNTSDLRQTIIDFGFLASGGATPLDLNGGALTAGHTNLGGGTNLTGASVGVTGFTGISAATTVMGFQVSATTPVSATNTVIGAQIGLTTPASTPILTSLGLYCPAAVLGGGGTMGRAVGVMVDPQSIGTNNCGVLISATYPPTYTGNYAIRSESTAQSTYAGGISSSHATAGIGYAVGAGGAVTQATSKATGVTLNTVCGTITLNGAALASVTSVAFTLTNSAIAANDLVVCHHDSVGTLGGYGIVVTPATGSATVTVRNMTAGSLSEAIVLRFVVIKAVNS